MNNVFEGVATPSAQTNHQLCHPGQRPGIQPALRPVLRSHLGVVGSYEQSESVVGALFFARNGLFFQGGGLPHLPSPLGPEGQAPSNPTREIATTRLRSFGASSGVRSVALMGQDLLIFFISAIERMSGVASGQSRHREFAAPARRSNERSEAKAGTGVQGTKSLGHEVEGGGAIPLPGKSALRARRTEMIEWMLKPVFALSWLRRGRQVQGDRTLTNCSFCTKFNYRTRVNY